MGRKGGSSQEDTGSGDEEKIPSQRKRGRPEKWQKDHDSDWEGTQNVKEEEEDSGDSWAAKTHNSERYKRNKLNFGKKHGSSQEDTGSSDEAPQRKRRGPRKWQKDHDSYWEGTKNVDEEDSGDSWSAKTNNSERYKRNKLNFGKKHGSSQEDTGSGDEAPRRKREKPEKWQKDHESDWEGTQNVKEEEDSRDFWAAKTNNSEKYTRKELDPVEEVTEVGVKVMKLTDNNEEDDFVKTRSFRHKSRSRKGKPQRAAR